MTFRIEIDHSIVHELVGSFCFHIHPPADKFIKGLDIGTEWFTERDLQFKDRKLDKLELQKSNYPELMKLLTWLCPKSDTVNDYLNWFSSLTAGDIYLLVEPYLDEKFSLPTDLSSQHSTASTFLKDWYDRYFHKYEQSFSTSLKDDVMRQRQGLEERINKEDFIEDLTGGLVIDERLPIKVLKIFPSTHFSPYFTSYTFGDMAVTCYPPDDVQSKDLIMNQKIINIAKALSDGRRLDIIRFLSQGKKTFKEITSELGTTKGTVHHHLLFLKAARLVTLYEVGDRQSYGYYGLRKNFPTEFKNYLEEIISG
ncbi:DNA-binding transcriptional ArsR family regulator [Bacillus mesophilus]|uniref:Winged helix-turn-helix transcriptional regulator n=1 Tax=Bacillus mesophilus TaxID=1808955 RepID=A0A6M0Q3H6_9BACI|nr:winged helix-turn-helix domain-containing protein [Bacillus mesophilus]MBM7660227.1 DNA-binding transcriptional ArsR family regulator [Bacillus mesophilus]NEY70945.1 winged helix-turn-helix transcriptional regulator [Bacillus mesophilus]